MMVLFGRGNFNARATQKQAEFNNRALYVDIQQLKKEWLNAQHAHDHWNQLIAKRDALENQIEQLHNQLDDNILQLHKAQHTNDSSSEVLSQEIAQQQSLLATARQKKQEIDHLLDAWEASNTLTIEQLRTRLIDAILQFKPDQQSTYLHMHSSIEQVQSRSAELEEVCQICAKLIEVLDVAMQIRQTVRRQLIFSYIFGENPNVRISQQLQEAEKLSKASLARLETHRAYHQPADGDVKEAYAEINTLLHNLQIQCGKRWGFKTLDTTFKQTLVALIALHKRFQSMLHTISQVQQSLENELTDWINQQCL